ncbi:DDE-type integrase/transposase/recombinase [Actinoplanes auranticolor]|uniref:Integrase catalytic domain-containing protein n=1 Tax=Actinoplanes auranticolor TaxID=47988 RepID=A0A919W2Y2_9ACTN|nr:DDE-type integrase/transposase/recombinase [Actinoplanes auranticolor]GIM77848.1 hypothetical protein Aau02nite_77960 [Actinoplanes auranticolor]
MTDPEFGYRFLADEAGAAGQAMVERTAWKICSGMGWWSAFGRKRRRGKGGRPGPPVHDDLVKRDFTAAGPNQLWLADITEHRTGEGKLYLCAIKDVWSNRIVGYSIDSRMKFQPQPQLIALASGARTARRVVRADHRPAYEERLRGAAGAGACRRRRSLQRYARRPRPGRRRHRPVHGVEAHGFRPGRHPYDRSTLPG